MTNHLDFRTISVGGVFTDSVVDLKMRTEIAALSKPLATSLAFEGLLSRVSTNVDFKSRRPHEGLVTILALERPLTSMSSHMI